MAEPEETPGDSPDRIERYLELIAIRDRLELELMNRREDIAEHGRYEKHDYKDLSYDALLEVYDEHCKELRLFYGRTSDEDEEPAVTDEGAPNPQVVSLLMDLSSYFHELHGAAVHWDRLASGEDRFIGSREILPEERQLLSQATTADYESFALLMASDMEHRLEMLKAYQEMLDLLKPYYLNEHSTRREAFELAPEHIQQRCYELAETFEGLRSWDTGGAWKKPWEDPEEHVIHAAVIEVHWENGEVGRLTPIEVTAVIGCMSGEEGYAPVEDLPSHLQVIVQRMQAGEEPNFVMPEQPE